MKSNIKNALVGAILTTMSTFVSAKDIDPSCLVSFNVENKTFDTGISTMSCTLLEERRGDLFLTINSLPTTNIISGQKVAAELRKIEQQLKALESETDYSGYVLVTTGNVLATLGLGTCFETLGAGCLLAGIGKAITSIQTINDLHDDSEKKAFYAKRRLEIEAQRRKIESSYLPAKQLRERLVLESNNLCAAVKKQCLAR